MPLLLTILAILTLVVLVAWFKLETFIAFVIISLGVGFASGLDPARTMAAITRGIGGTLGSLVIILGFGAMLGKLVGDSGAAQRITTALLAWFGPARIQWALALAGFIVGLPLFYTAGHAPAGFAAKTLPEEQLPSLGTSIISALLPVFLLASSAILLPLLPDPHPARFVITTIGEPHIAML